MSEHDTFVAERGAAIIFCEWTGSAYVEHQAMIRAITSTPAGPNEPTVNLTYSDGVGATLAANVPNIETKSGDVDCWRAIYRKDVNWALQSQSNTRPMQGQLVWIGIWDPTDEDHAWFLGFVLAVLGAPTLPKPNINATYVNAAGDSTNVEQVVAATTLSNPEGEDIWLDYVDAPA